jgi:modulator of FtsH protease
VGGYEPGEWADFGVAVAGAGAALAGLLFVALSINLDRILTGYRLTTRASRTLVLLGVPLVIALLMLIPGQTGVALGAELAVVGVVTGVWLAFLNRPGARSPQQAPASWVITEVAPAVLLSASTVVGGVGTMTGSLGGLYWVPVGVIAAFVAALLNAWVLLVEILR